MDQADLMKLIRTFSKRQKCQSAILLLFLLFVDCIEIRVVEEARRARRLTFRVIIEIET